MSKIFFSLSGEGRGHATRVRALVERLRLDHDITIFAPEDAYRLLAPIYAETDVRVCWIPGLVFHYTRGHRLDFARTTREGLGYLASLSRLVSRLEGVIRWERPDLVVTDFEPSLPRAAHRCGVPFLSVNHQHFLLYSDLSSLPLHLRAHARLMAQVVRRYYAGQAESIVSSFYFPPLKNGIENVSQVGVFLRPEVLGAIPSDDGHLVAYLRRFAPENVIESLRATGRQVRIYGLGLRPDDGNLRYCEIDATRFVEDLASASALVCTAGNQLVGEAFALGKPVFAMPETRNYEQYINAHFVEQSGAGTWVEIEKCRAGNLVAFLRKLDEYRGNMPIERTDWAQVAMRRILSHVQPSVELKTGAAYAPTFGKLVAS
ncbi:teichoic acid biosynthesis protein [bacterium]|nr:teichoic acid biosynthesis protein [bacterium]